MMWAGVVNAALTRRQELPGPAESPRRNGSQDDAWMEIDF
jgi:hypothetical protein